MVYQILIQTPVWVWAILALLIYRGVGAMRDQPFSIPRLIMVPAFFLLLSVSGLLRHFGTSSLQFWVLGMTAGIAITWQLLGQNLVSKQAGAWVIRGSALPMALMLLTFTIKYLSEVSMAIAPTVMLAGIWVWLLPLGFGVLNGLFLGRSIRLWTDRRSASLVMV